MYRVTVMLCIADASTEYGTETVSGYSMTTKYKYYDVQVQYRDKDRNRYKVQSREMPQ